MARSVYLLGGGGHGRVVLETLIASGLSVSGILDPRLKVGTQLFAVPVLGSDEFLNNIPPTNICLVNGLGAASNTTARAQIFNEMTQKGFVFQAVQHPSATIGLECSLGDNAQVMAGAVLQNRVQVGPNVVINTRASIDHDCVLSAHVFISPGAIVCGDVVVAESAFIGAGAVLLPGVHIGARAVVGAGSIVINTVPEGWTVAGNPATRIGGIGH